MTQTARRLAAVIALAVASAACGPSAEDKARIRLAVSAFKLAGDVHGGGSESGISKSRMDDLQKAIDVVPDGHARDALLDCQRLLVSYKHAERMIESQLETNLLKTGNGREPTKADFDRAMAKAKAEYPMPDYEPLSRCTVGLIVLSP
jgi:hypothetical protein